MSPRSWQRRRADLLISGAGADLRIQCGTRTLPIVRSIVYGQSDFLDELIDRASEQNRTGLIDLADDDPTFVAAILWWMYTRDHAFSGIFEGDEPFSVRLAQLVPEFADLRDKQVMSNIKMCDMADRFIVPHIGAAARDRLRGWLCSGRPDCTIGNLADLDEALSYLYTQSDSHLLKCLVPSVILSDISGWGNQEEVCHAWLEHHQAIPTFSRFWMRERELAEQRWTCCRCEQVRRREPKTLLVKKGAVNEPWGTMEWITCWCGFRGLCSEECMSLGPIDPFMVWCSECRDHGIKKSSTIRGRYYTDGRVLNRSKGWGVIRPFEDNKQAVCKVDRLRRDQAPVVTMTGTEDLSQGEQDSLEPTKSWRM